MQYTTDRMYRNLSNEITAPLDTEFSIVDVPISGTTYYLLFTVLVNNTLQATDRFNFSFTAPAGTIITFLLTLNL